MLGLLKISDFSKLLVYKYLFEGIEARILSEFSEFQYYTGVD